MGQLIKHEFVGSKLLLFLICITIVGIPIGVVYLITRTVTVVEEMDEPMEFINEFLAGDVGHKPRI